MDNKPFNLFFWATTCPGMPDKVVRLKLLLNN
jgi:hypothetical protein